ncbi:ribose-5-phosphate isomerase [Candidatus Azambacteria bacterium RBG_16_47_10]|uniref:Ribose-5-phosphate isomerase n=1 Tax=Candidatus Azambacteria bacterium RBG_16_47_10 TaxID=1797292 RepID=A0A1F5AZ22_9BACT|nr:MAG: ribose-5-phosphate isomerase [Candidatus Azambacteria bacterium RBG_16_47_10]
MTIYLAADHAGFALKEKVKLFLESGGYTVADMGAYEENKDDDYPDFMSAAAQAIANDLIRGIDSKGIIFGGSGQGEAMAANRIDGVRAAVYYGGPTDIVILSRQHNDANILSLGARFVSGDEALAAVKLWLETPFSNEERHRRRILKF